MVDLTDTLRALDAELVADRREVAADAFTTAEYAAANGIGETTAMRRLKLLVTAGKVERTWKQSGVGKVPAWRRK